jgi:hypothetical protein
MIEDNESCHQDRKKRDVRQVDARSVESPRSAASPVGRGRGGEGRTVEGLARALHCPEKETALGQPKLSGKEREVATLGHLEKSIEEREELCPGEPRHNSGIRKGDALASSRAQEGLQNNKIHCYTKEKVSKTKEAHTVPPPVVQMNHLPSIPLPTRSEMHNDPS